MIYLYIYLITILVCSIYKFFVTAHEMKKSALDVSLHDFLFFNGNPTFPLFFVLFPIGNLFFVCVSIIILMYEFFSNVLELKLKTLTIRTILKGKNK